MAGAADSLREVGDNNQENEHAEAQEASVERKTVFRTEFVNARYRNRIRDRRSDGQYNQAYCHAQNDFTPLVVRHRKYMPASNFPLKCPPNGKSETLVRFQSPKELKFPCSSTRLHVSPHYLRKRDGNSA